MPVFLKLYEYKFRKLAKILSVSMKHILLIIILTLSFYGCKNDRKSVDQFQNKVHNNSLIKDAKGIEIKHFNTFTKLTVKTPYPNASETFNYYLIPRRSIIPDSLKNKVIIRTPVKRIVATSTTHIPMIELFHRENTLVGFPQTSYISSERTATLVKKGKVRELGNTRDINTEILIDLNPDVVIGFSLSHNNKMYQNIENAGIPVIYNGDWLEETPLGRAEWIKLFGVLFDKEQESDSIFNTIRTKYLQAKKLALTAKNKPVILSGVLYKDKWNLPAGKSFTATLFKDAHTDYLWKNSKGKGSLVLSFESVFVKGGQADFWIGAGMYTSFEQMKEADEHYTRFKAFKNRNIYTFSKKRGVNGGVIYYELSPIQPHFVLQDLIRVTHPELLPGYQLHFLEKLDN